MTKEDDLSPDHISWLVQSRTRNQEISLKLYLIMKDNAEILSSNFQMNDFAQALVTVCFSLWRAVFLSDVSDTDDRVISDAQSFLGNLILHNMVAYPQDRNTRDWTFIYYVNNARYRLESISADRRDILPASFVDKTIPLTAKDLWTYYQNAAETAVRNFELALRKARVKT